MDLNKSYDSNINWIGATDKQKRFTKYLYKRYSAINYTAFCHDRLYTLMLQERGWVSRLFLKILFDIVFLGMGIIRSLGTVFRIPTSWEQFKKICQLDGIIVVSIMYVILALATIFMPSTWNR